MPGIERYFGHFSPTLRSIVVAIPLYSSTAITFPLSFSKLDNITDLGYLSFTPDTTIPRYGARSVLHAEAARVAGAL
jgi:hypothetical protein